MIAKVQKNGLLSSGDGRPQVVYLEQALNDQFGPSSVRVICPITDPFVEEHDLTGLTGHRLRSHGGLSQEFLLA